MREDWSYAAMNEIFRKVLQGAELIAMQKNKYWSPSGRELYLDAGAFIHAIEFASGKDAVLIGKPSPIYFKSALELLGHKTDSKFIMIGDDLETDIRGAQTPGGIEILVYTGKTTYPLGKNSTIKPDYEAFNLGEVIKLLRSLPSI